MASVTGSRAAGAADITGSETWLFTFDIAIEPSVYLSENTIEQGGVAAIRVTGSYEDDAPTLTTTLKNQGFIQSSNGWVCYLPIPWNAALGTETIDVQVGRYSAAVLAVTSAGGVRTRVARVDTGLTRDDAANLAQLLNRGLTFVAPQDLNPMLTASMVLAAGERLAPVVMAACALVTTGPQACLEGAQYLAKMPDVRQNLGTLLEIFSDNEAAAELIRPEGGKITATLGSDLDPAMPGACIVSKRYLAGGGLTGSVALIGSTRMEYHRLLPILNYFATKLGQSMAGQGQ